MCKKFFFVLKGQFILAQWHRLGKKFRSLLAGLKAQLNISCPFRAKKQCVTYFLPKVTLRFAIGLN